MLNSAGRCAASSSIITPLRGREFRLLFVGQLVSFFGSMITFVAVPFQVYELTELDAGGRRARRGASSSRS